MWVDLLVEEILATRTGPHIVNDAWTPSGFAHVGSLRGVVLHDAVARGLAERGHPVEFFYGFDDFDPMDGLPPHLPRDFYQAHMGRPLCDVPWHEPDAASLGRYFADDFEATFRALGCRPHVYRTSEMYRSGQFNDAIRVVLESADQIVAIEREITGSQRAERHPIQVLCERCGRIGTTVVRGWDGRYVEYECRPDKVVWATGCGHRGRRSPFDGGAKMTYRTEWAAKWKVLGVTVEGAGKDHMTRGGTHDTASVVAERIFGIRVPFPIPYEFFLVGGRRISSSSGRGVPAKELLDVLRPELVRFLVVRSYYRSAINFDPGGDTVPRLYDEYDRAAAAYFGELQAQTPGQAQDVYDLARSFHYAWLGDSAPEPFWRPRFLQVAILVQMPHVRLEEAVEHDKGAPLTDADRRELAARAADARRWLARWAPGAYRFEVRDRLPENTLALSAEQRTFLERLAAAVESDRMDAQALHARIHDLKNEMGLAAQQAFGAIYLAFLGKTSGPQAGAFLAALDREFVVRRLREAARAGRQATGGGP
ncbi:MAG: lysine--tRNA ligase [Armatimonadota bacterium]|nr:lysine--tRNA ligase [Armatimonadota bacterium]MDR5697585.1 lysine--tRNA ligase [Armatimonadota bacterium]